MTRKKPTFTAPTRKSSRFKESTSENQVNKSAKQEEASRTDSKPNDSKDEVPVQKDESKDVNVKHEEIKQENAKTPVVTDKTNETKGGLEKHVLNNSETGSPREKDDDTKVANDTEVAENTKIEDEQKNDKEHCTKDETENGKETKDADDAEAAAEAAEKEREKARLAMEKRHADTTRALTGKMTREEWKEWQWNEANARNAARAEAQRASGELEYFKPKVKKQVDLTTMSEEEVKQYHIQQRKHKLDALWMYYSLEEKLVTAYLEIKMSLTKEDPQVDKVIRILKAVQRLYIPQSMILNNPQMMEVLVKLRRYKPEPKIRFIAKQVYNKFCCMFAVPERETFLHFFRRKAKEEKEKIEKEREKHKPKKKRKKKKKKPVEATENPENGTKELTPVEEKKTEGGDTEETTTASCGNDNDNETKPEKEAKPKDQVEGEKPSGETMHFETGDAKKNEDDESDSGEETDDDSDDNDEDGNSSATDTDDSTLDNEVPFWEDENADLPNFVEEEFYDPVDISISEFASFFQSLTNNRYVGEGEQPQFKTKSKKRNRDDDSDSDSDSSDYVSCESDISSFQVTPQKSSPKKSTKATKPVVERPPPREGTRKSSRSAAKNAVDRIKSFVNLDMQSVSETADDYIDYEKLNNGEYVPKKELEKITEEEEVNEEKEEGRAIEELEKSNKQLEEMDKILEQSDDENEDVDGDDEDEDDKGKQKNKKEVLKVKIKSPLLQRKRSQATSPDVKDSSDQNMKSPARKRPRSGRAVRRLTSTPTKEDRSEAKNEEILNLSKETASKDENTAENHPSTKAKLPTSMEKDVVENENHTTAKVQQSAELIDKKSTNSPMSRAKAAIEKARTRSPRFTSPVGRKTTLKSPKPQASNTTEKEKESSENNTYSHKNLAQKLGKEMKEECMSPKAQASKLLKQKKGYKSPKLPTKLPRLEAASPPRLLVNDPLLSPAQLIQMALKRKKQEETEPEPETEEQKGKKPKRNVREADSKVDKSESKEKASDSKVKALDCKEKASDIKGKASESKGKTSDMKGNASESKGKTSDVKGKASESKGKTSDSKTKSSESKGKASDIKGNASESSSHKMQEVSEKISNENVKSPVTRNIRRAKASQVPEEEITKENTMSPTPALDIMHSPPEEKSDVRPTRRSRRNDYKPTDMGSPTVSKLSKSKKEDSAENMDVQMETEESELIGKGKTGKGASKIAAPEPSKLVNDAVGKKRLRGCRDENKDNNKESDAEKKDGKKTDKEKEEPMDVECQSTRAGNSTRLNRNARASRSSVRSKSTDEIKMEKIEHKRGPDNSKQEPICNVGEEIDAKTSVEDNLKVRRGRSGRCGRSHSNNTPPGKDGNNVKSPTKNVKQQPEVKQKTSTENQIQPKMEVKRNLRKPHGNLEQDNTIDSQESSKSLEIFVKEDLVTEPQATHIGKRRIIGQVFSPSSSLSLRSMKSQSPSSEKTGKSPTSSSEKTMKSPTPSSEKTMKAPTPSSEKTGKFPTPSSEKTMKSPAPSSEKTRKFPNPSSEKTGKSPNPSSEKTGKSPNPSSEKTRKSPTPSSQIDKKTMISPGEKTNKKRGETGEKLGSDVDEPMQSPRTRSSARNMAKISSPKS